MMQLARRIAFLQDSPKVLKMPFPVIPKPHITSFHREPHPEISPHGSFDKNDKLNILCPMSPFTIPMHQLQRRGLNILMPVSVRGCGSGRDVLCFRIPDVMIS